MKNSEVADIVRALMKGVITQRHAIKKLETLVNKGYVDAAKDLTMADHIRQVPIKTIVGADEDVPGYHEATGEVQP